MMISVDQKPVITYLPILINKRREKCSWGRINTGGTPVQFAPEGRTGRVLTTNESNWKTGGFFLFRFIRRERSEGGKDSEERLRGCACYPWGLMDRFGCFFEWDYYCKVSVRFQYGPFATATIDYQNKMGSSGGSWNIQYLPLKLVEPVPSDIVISRNQTPKNIEQIIHMLGYVALLYHLQYLSAIDEL
ncbi:hypothetical protein NECAME_01979 [Necator americanus]|uniref:Uncharacterized protein n=1 Tax=Necator americanus TaxID=51031 RepID=W2TM22_NECAM|nr:hypothetical protein NECAME_01979 [Necator americanus]ETN82694.1 hypothetical protein NECAME_01979 [Necator americanus]